MAGVIVTLGVESGFDLPEEDTKKDINYRIQYGISYYVDSKQADRK